LLFGQHDSVQRVDAGTRLVGEGNWETFQRTATWRQAAGPPAATIGRWRPFSFCTTHTSGAGYCMRQTGSVPPASKINAFYVLNCTKLSSARDILFKSQ
jgi:hypothetical protein